MTEKRLTPADCVVQAFGSIRATARAIGASAGNVSKWVSRGIVPAHLQEQILLTAQAKGLDLSADDIIRGRRTEAAV